MERDYGRIYEEEQRWNTQYGWPGHLSKEQQLKDELWRIKQEALKKEKKDGSKISDKPGA